METVNVRSNDRPQSWSYIYPVQGEMTDGYGYRAWRGRTHHGIDLAVPIGTSVLAARDGKVTYVGYDEGGYGNWIEIEHPNGHSTRYGHLDSTNVKVGQTVTRGQVIAASGNTGGSTGPHLHFEIRNNGQSTNPIDWLPPDPAWKPTASAPRTVPNPPAENKLPTPPKDTTLDPSDAAAAAGGFVLTVRALQIIGTIQQRSAQIGEMLVFQDKLPKPVVDRARRLAPKIPESLVRQIRGLGQFQTFLRTIGVPLSLAIALVLVTAEPTGDDSVFVRRETDKDDDKPKDNETKSGRSIPPAEGVMYWPKGRLFTRNFKR